MSGLCEVGNEPSGSLKVLCNWRKNPNTLPLEIYSALFQALGLSWTGLIPTLFHTLPVASPPADKYAELCPVV
ncbi:hypothetical protein ANN_23524 [Periplaneta americana]|uniref:Uncharacterized protein n=1 Tax=Periplaneta americana TaxID=6978 RepID=A0ABQ8SLD7_PERAM|nr:hypothetical protein ANN_23524 [Periplaneta americana]